MEDESTLSEGIRYTLAVLDEMDKVCDYITKQANERFVPLKEGLDGFLSAVFETSATAPTLEKLREVPAFREGMKRINGLKEYIEGSNDDKKEYAFIAGKKAGILQRINRLLDSEHLYTFVDLLHICINYIGIHLIGEHRGEDGEIEDLFDEIDPVFTSLTSHYNPVRSTPIDPDDVPFNLTTLRYLNRIIGYFMSGSRWENMRMSDFYEFLDNDTRIAFVGYNRTGDIHPSDYETEIGQYDCYSYFDGIKKRLLGLIVV